jgi:REP-associated tyrosine transposase
MSRPLRIEYPGAWYHVMNRGRRKEDIFLSRTDYETFIKILQETSSSWNIKIAAYCLIPSHYHLLVQTPDGNISRCMRHINGVYTQRFNRNHKTDGQLFRGRYKAVLIAADNHLLEVLRYIHKNPLRAGITKNLSDFSWSSHPGYIANTKKWQWMHKDGLLSMISAKKNKRKSAYLDFISQAESEETERFYSLKNLPSIMGSNSFKEWVKEKFHHLRFKEEIPGSRELAPSPETIIALVCDHFKIKQEQIATSKRGTENLPRDVAIYLVRHHNRATLTSVGKHFGIENYSTVSSAVERVKLRMKQDRILQKHLKMIGTQIAKSQQ